MDTRIGTCSACGGPVVVSSYAPWPTPHCQYCGAIPQAAGQRVNEPIRPVPERVRGSRQ